MSVWLTPDLKPFYGGTYFPPDARWGRPGFPEILREIRAGLAAGAREGAAVGREPHRTDPRVCGRCRPAEMCPRPMRSRKAWRSLRRPSTRHAAGSASAPKFPRPSELLFLLRETARTGDYTPAFMVAKTLQPMALGGMRDHVGGGFHRYSVDANWRVPHFEKMLYDQAQITLACLETYQLAADRFFAEVAEDTLEYVMREMTNPEGGFFSAEDADSVPPEDASNPQCAQDGRRVLSVDAGRTAGAARRTTSTCSATASAFDRTAMRQRIRKGSSRARTCFTSRARSRKWRSEPASRARTSTRRCSDRACSLFQARLSRPRPHLDDKVLTGWNGLMLASFARAGRVLAGCRRARALSRRGRASRRVPRAAHVGIGAGRSSSAATEKETPRSTDTPKTTRI